MKYNGFKLWALFGIIVASAGTANAQQSGAKVILQNAEGVADTAGTGWNPHLKLTGNFALGQSKNIPGAPDGVSLQLGYIIGANLDYLSPTKRHEWANSLGLELAYTRTPVVDAFIKSIDAIDFRSAYLYHIERVPWLGPFIAFRLSTPMLPADLVRAEPTNVYRLEVGEAQTADDGTGQIVDENGTVVDANHPSVRAYESGDRIKLTSAFAPLTVRESAGLFAIPLDKPWLKIDARLGFGAWETFVRKGFVVADNADTADLFELLRMQDSVQLGPELGVILAGAAKELLTYGFSALLMQPVYNNADTGLTGFELINVELEAKLGVRISKYVAIDYSFKAYKQPLIIDEWQIQNNLLLSINFEIPYAAPPPPCPPAAPCPECPPPPPAPAAAAPAAATTAPDSTASAESAPSESPAAAPESADDATATPAEPTEKPVE